MFSYHRSQIVVENLQVFVWSNIAFNCCNRADSVPCNATPNHNSETWLRPRSSTTSGLQPSSVFSKNPVLPLFSFLTTLFLFTSRITTFFLANRLTNSFLCRCKCTVLLDIDCCLCSLNLSVISQKLPLLFVSTSRSNLR